MEEEINLIKLIEKILKENPKLKNKVKIKKKEYITKEKKIDRTLKVVRFPSPVSC